MIKGTVRERERAETWSETKAEEAFSESLGRRGMGKHRKNDGDADLGQG